MLPSPQFASYPGSGCVPLSLELRRESPIIGRSPALLNALEQARQAARSDADILLEAESGTGKELLARLIHEASPRAARPFVAINCAAVPENLLESELFGHVRGAFTGALARNAGKFELADGGTLLLDEIGEMPLALQPKLLRVLQEREFYRLGDVRPIRVDVRVIASTNRSLQSLVREGRFREDLYYRLNVIPLGLPPLRERGQDVIELAEYFAAKFAAPARPPAMSESFRIALRSHRWPGNVRELANTIRRAVALCDGDEIKGDALRTVAPPALGPAPWLKPGLSLREAEKALLEITLEATAGNRTHAAELLGISLRTVRNKIREHGLPPRRLA
ncbi:MAG: sigma 54-interacting transcriptional regulator [Candidatus Korobacteraceae bacterium]